MKTNRIITFLLFIYLFCPAYAQDVYYWRNNQKLQLQTSYKKIYVLAQNAADTALITKQLREEGIQFQPFEKVSVGISKYDVECFWSIASMNDYAIAVDIVRR